MPIIETRNQSPEAEKLVNCQTKRAQPKKGAFFYRKHGGKIYVTGKPEKHNRHENLTLDVELEKRHMGRSDLRSGQFENFSSTAEHNEIFENQSIRTSVYSEVVVNTEATLL